MSELGSIIEYSVNMEEAEAPVALPPGDYPAKVVAAENGVSQSSGKSRVDVTLRIAPEDYPADYEDAASFPDGKDVHIYPSSENNKAAQFRMRKFMEALGAKIKGNKIDPNDWIGRETIVTIERDTFEGVDRERVVKVSAK